MEFVLFIIVSDSSESVSDSVSETSANDIVGLEKWILARL